MYSLVFFFLLLIYSLPYILYSSSVWLQSVTPCDSLLRLTVVSTAFQGCICTCIVLSTILTFPLSWLHLSRIKHHLFWKIKPWMSLASISTFLNDSLSIYQTNIMNNTKPCLIWAGVEQTEHGHTVCHFWAPFLFRLGNRVATWKNPDD